MSILVLQYNVAVPVLETLHSYRDKGKLLVLIFPGLVLVLLSLLTTNYVVTFISQILSNKNKS